MCAVLTTNSRMFQGLLLLLLAAVVLLLLEIICNAYGSRTSSIFKSFDLTSSSADPHSGT